MTGKSGQVEPRGASYASAGVDIEAGDRAVELFKPLAKFDLTASMGNISNKQSQHSVLLFCPAGWLQFGHFR